MGIRIKNERAKRLARKVAAETGESLTEAIIHSLEERLERLKGRRSAPDLAETLMAIGRRCSSLPDLVRSDVGLSARLIVEEQALQLGWC